ncbi:MAG: hypothetical protein JOZ57_13040 [Abitibacteriaceae bacterium]|nr:hypothetical protein [Abditibacteriaceae bacterium]
MRKTKAERDAQEQERKKAFAIRHKAWHQEQAARYERFLNGTASSDDMLKVSLSFSFSSEEVRRRDKLADRSWREAQSKVRKRKGTRGMYAQGNGLTVEDRVEG